MGLQSLLSLISYTSQPNHVDYNGEITGDSHVRKISPRNEIRTGAHWRVNLTTYRWTTQGLTTIITSTPIVKNRHHGAMVKWTIRQQK